jgi:3-oxoacyl-[acyl-carrier protein] reductase|uniref:SDR family NAD(P)-dependent oxidoreductase n=1 Tax=Pseudomonadota TaxID=1224 RepID=UPI004047067B
MSTISASSNKVAIITGAASGVGAATARLLARKGYALLVNYNRSAVLADEVVSDCKSLGADAIAGHGDVSDDAVCRRLAAQALERWGRIDALVNSAGSTLFVPMSQLDAVDAVDFHNIYGVNAIGPFQMARAVSAHMGNNSAIVNVSSVAGQTGIGSSFPYVLSKAALNALTVGLSRALAPKIRVNAVLPGMIEGRWMRDGLGEEAYERVKKQFAETALLERVATPDHIAESIGWLLDPGCLMTGQLMVVDGGATLGRPPAAAGKR